MSKIILEVVNNNTFRTGAGSEIFINSEERVKGLRIGRDSKRASLVVEPHHGEVSREHCMIWWQHPVWVIGDLHSKNKTYIKRKNKIDEVGGVVALMIGDIILIGSNALTNETVTLRVKNISTREGDIVTQKVR